MKCIENNGDRFLIEFTKAEVDELWWFECYPREGQDMGEFCMATYLAELYPDELKEFHRSNDDKAIEKVRLRSETLDGLTDPRRRRN